jgi:type I restriction enzyme S subunit
LSENPTLKSSWQRDRLAQICEIVPGRHIAEPDHNKEGRGVPYLTGPSDFGSLRATASRWTEHPDVMCQPSDVLVVVKGAGVANTNLAPEKPACIGRQLMAVRAKHKAADPHYIYFALALKKKSLRQQAMGATVPGLSIEHLENLTIPVCELSDQRRIAARLSEQLAEVDKARAAVQAQLNAAQILPAAQLRAFFDGPEIKSCQAKPLEAIARLQRGRFSPRPRNNPRFYGGQYPFIQTGSVATEDGYIRTFTQTLNADGLAVSKLFKKGTLVISIAANIGSLGILDFDSCMPDSLVGITPIPGAADTRFLYYSLLSQQKSIQQLAPAMAQANLSLARLAPMLHRAPSLEQQRSIASSLDLITTANATHRSALQDRLAALDVLPVALLREAFAGT